MAQAVTLQTVPAIGAEDTTGRCKKLWLRLIQRLSLKTNQQQQEKKVKIPQTQRGRYFSDTSLSSGNSLA